MDMTKKPVEQTTSPHSHQDQALIELVEQLQHIPPPRPKRRFRRRVRPRSTRPACPTDLACSICLARSSCLRYLTLPANRHSGRPSKKVDVLFHRPPGITNGTLSDPATRVLVNTPQATLVAYTVKRGGPIFTSWCPPPANEGRAYVRMVKAWGIVLRQNCK